jgi:hypothetical protein
MMKMMCGHMKRMILMMMRSSLSEPLQASGDHWEMVIEVKKRGGSWTT